MSQHLITSTQFSNKLLCEFCTDKSECEDRTGKGSEVDTS